MLTDKASIEKGIRFWSVGILGGLLVMLGASLYFIDQEKKEAEARLYIPKYLPHSRRIWA